MVSRGTPNPFLAPGVHALCPLHITFYLPPAGGDVNKQERPVHNWLCYLICSWDVDVVGPAPGSSPTRVGSNEVARQKSSSNTTCAKTTGWEGGKQSELARVKTHNSNSNVNKQTLSSGAPRGHSFTEGKKNRRIEGCKYGLGRDLRQA